MSRGQRQPPWGRGGGFGSPNNPLYQHHQNPSHVNTSQMAYQNNQPWGGPSIDYYDQSYSDQSQYSGHDYSSSSYSEGSSQNSRHQFIPRTPRGQHQQHNHMSPGGPSASSTPIRNPHNNSGPSPSQGGRGYNHHDRTGSGPSPSQKGRGNRPHDRTGSRERGQQNYRGHQSYGQRRDRSSSGNRSQNSDRSFSPRRQGWNDDPMVFLSKTLSSILRHNAEKFGFTLMKGGFLYVSDILKYTRKLHGFTTEDVVAVVKSNDKQRFTLENGEYGLKIRANQGHSLEVEDLDLKPITDPDEFPVVIHGTYYEAWEMIKRTGLKRMKRNHIHFAPGLPGASGVISGMRASCEVLIYLDLEKAVKDGLEFFISSNNVILSPGNEDGVILPKYFNGAIDKYYGSRIEFDAKDSEKSGAGTEGNEPEKKRKKNKGKKKNKDQRNESNSSHSSTDNSVEPPVKKSANSTSDWEVSGKEKEKVTETTSYPVDTGILSQLKDTYEDHSEDSDDGETNGENLDDIEVVEIEDVETCQTEISTLLSTVLPFVVVICKGDKLGMEQSHIHQLAIGANSSLYVFDLQNKQLMIEGRLKEWLLNKTPKVFSRVEEVSHSLINEYNILLDGVPIWDLEILFEKLPDQMNSKDKTALQKLNFEKDMFVKWSKANNKAEECMDDLKQQAILMYRMFEIFKSSTEKQGVKSIKTEIYQKAVPKGEEHFLSEKIIQLKLEKKAQKKNEKGTGQQAVENKQEQQAGGSGGGKDKRNTITSQQEETHRNTILDSERIMLEKEKLEFEIEKLKSDINLNKLKEETLMSLKTFADTANSYYQEKLRTYLVTDISSLGNI